MARFLVPRTWVGRKRTLQGNLRTRHLRNFIRRTTGVEIADTPVCRGHHTPWEFFQEIYYKRPSLALILGPRGGGKSFLTALETHVQSLWMPNHATRILGGSLSQSEQVYQALRDIVRGSEDEREVLKLLKEGAHYRNGSEVKILAASSTSVRGPHVPSLKLDEVDEIDPDCRESAMGMCMNRNGIPASVIMSSTWHRIGGPMSLLMERAQGGEFPLYSFCVFEILERCPDERSGANLEKCPECPLVRWCHEDRGSDPLGRPKAKRSRGHYAIDALIQKIRATSLRTFESDYLCRGPRADGLWFPAFDAASSVTEEAEFDPTLPVHLALDPGVVTGAVFFQIKPRRTPEGTIEEVRVFADYLGENKPAEQNGRDIVEVARTHCLGRINTSWIDPNGGSRTPIGPTVLGELERGGLRSLKPWPRGSVADSLALVESLVQPADGEPRLRLHPRCVVTIQALQNYRRAKRGGQWQDYPEDPQHPHEDLVDALRGGLRACFPEGRRPQASLPRIPARQVF